MHAMRNPPHGTWGCTPLLTGCLMAQEARRAFRNGEHARRSSSGILTCEEGWRLYGLGAPPPQRVQEKTGAQGKISAFFSKTPVASPTAPPASCSIPPASPARSDGTVDFTERIGGAGDEEMRWEAEVANLTERRLAIARAAGHVDGGPLLHTFCTASFCTASFCTASFCTASFYTASFTPFPSMHCSIR